MGYEMSIKWKNNAISTNKNLIKINISSQAFMDDVTWITNNKYKLQQMLSILNRRIQLFK
jgi:hypothetical protein